MDDKAVYVTALGAFLFGAVFFGGLIAFGIAGNAVALKAGVAGVGASYFAQVLEAYRLVSGAAILRAPMLVFWLIAVVCGLIGFVAVMGA